MAERATGDGTRRVVDLAPGRSASAPRYLTAAGNTIFFAAFGRTQLWRSDGTAAGTTLVRDMTSGDEGSPEITQLTAAGESLFFVATDPTHGRELWRSDGTAAGTELARDIWPGAAGAQPSSLTAVGDAVFFFARSGESTLELWKADAAGTALVKRLDQEPASPIRNVFDLNGVFLFSHEDPAHGLELWRSDGTEAGTFLVQDIVPGPAGGLGSSFQSFERLGDSILFLAHDGIHGAELWRSDGTAAGTALVRDIRRGPKGQEWKTPLPFSIAAAGGVAFLTARDGIHGHELWRTDGSRKGTYLARDIRPGPAGSDPSLLSPSDDAVFFSAYDGRRGTELWLARSGAIGN